MLQPGTKVAAYCRVSTADQDCDRQLRDLRAYAQRAGFELVTTFVETASGADSNRPERKKAMAMARSREIGAILVTELSRWGRSTSDLVQTLDDLHGWSVSVLAMNGASFDLNTASGRLLRTILASLAEFERDLLRERVRSGMAAARARGSKIGRQVGQRPSDKKASKVLAHRAEGMSIRAISRHLQLSTRTVQDVLKRAAPQEASA